MTYRLSDRATVPKLSSLTYIVRSFVFITLSSADLAAFLISSVLSSMSIKGSKASIRVLSPTCAGVYLDKACTDFQSASAPIRAVISVFESGNASDSDDSRKMLEIKACKKNNAPLVPSIFTSNALTIFSSSVRGPERSLVRFPRASQEHRLLDVSF